MSEETLNQYELLFIRAFISEILDGVRYNLIFFFLSDIGPTLHINIGSGQPYLVPSHHLSPRTVSNVHLQWGRKKQQVVFLKYVK